MSKETDDILSVRIKALDLGPGDILVVLYPRRLSDHAFEKIRKSLREILAIADNKIFILEEGMDLKIVRPQDLFKAPTERGVLPE